jgi:hypothetical protein
MPVWLFRIAPSRRRACSTLPHPPRRRGRPGPGGGGGSCTEGCRFPVLPPRPGGLGKPGSSAGGAQPAGPMASSPVIMIAARGPRPRCPWPDPPAVPGSRRAEPQSEGKCRPGGSGGSQIRPSRPAEDSEPVQPDSESDGSQVRAHWHGGKRRWAATASWPAWTHEGTPSRVRCMRIAPEMFTMRFCQFNFPGRSNLFRRSFGQSRQRYSATDSAAPPGGGGDHAHSLRLASCRLYLASLFAPAINAQRHSTVHERKECRIH